MSVLAVDLSSLPKRRRDIPDSIVGLISGESVNIWFMHSLHNAFKTDQGNRFGADWLLVYGPYIHQNRNRLMHEFMELDRDWFFMVDNDMVFEPADVWRLFMEADRRGPGIYSAPYVLESSALVCGPWDDEKPMAYHPMMLLPGGTTQVGVVGAGFTLVHRDVFEAVGESAFSPVEEDTGEDVSFCWRAREAGYVPWLVPECNPGHKKTVVLFPHEQTRNMVGDDVNLVETDPHLRAKNDELLKGV